MKYKLIDAYYDVKLNLPAHTYKESCKIWGRLGRIADILWVRYGYDITLTKSFK